MKMTRRRIQYALSRINIRRHNEYAGTAAFHGLRIEPIQIGVRALAEFSDEENAKAEAAMASAMARKRAELAEARRR